ncbi:MAG TPA: dephospho-CoA kinase [Bacillus sp. (in: firmicutes)]|uniref:dephospho-CoA kinase n=1 Tax=Bacillus litorisediminis TaxID=2922713 RepID=UPI001FAD9EF5|nr:dephospho-CoA kinase [Bacillus litorisediminis]HWO75512.1 dephospho-CoA kinase [Bacillus sp. (in: firmicutes)]
MMNTIGITGGISSGKSTVSNTLKEWGFTVIDADVQARVVVEPNQEAYQEIVKSFGSDILLPDGHINRSKLGQIIFNDKEKRDLLNSIVHPAVRKNMLSERDKAFARGEKTVFMDIPLLYESKLTHYVEKVIVVYVDPSVQLKRLMQRNQLTEEEALSRINAQLPLEDKKNWADAVINNNGTIEETKQQLKKILEEWNLF